MRFSTLVLVLLATSPALAQENDKPQTLQLPATVRITREMDASFLKPTNREYVVECRVVSENLSFSLPTITVRDGERVTIADTTTSARVIAHRTENGTRIPITRETTEGTIARITVIGGDDQQIVVDATLEVRGSPRKIDESLRDKRFSGLRGQVVDSIAIGETVSCPLDTEGRFEVTVTVK